MKKLYIIPQTKIGESLLPSSIICNSKEFTTQPTSGNGGNALGQETMEGGGEGDGTDINGAKGFYVGYNDDSF